MRRALLFIVAWACVLLLPARVDARPGRDRIVRLRAAVAEVLRREGVPGVGLALVDRSGVIWAGGVGTADLEGLRPVGDDTLFRVASITKSFVALGVARLHERGRLDLDAPVAPLLPDVELPNRWSQEAPVTLAHLLEHTAGFDDMHLDEFWGEGAEALPLHDVLARNPRSRATRWRPGTRFSYSNPGYTVAAAALERVTGERYQDFLHREVLAPLGIEDARFGFDPAIADRLSDGHDAPNHKTPYVGIYHHPAGALITSPAELAKLTHHLLVRSDAVVGPAMLDRIERSDTLPYAARDVDFGLGNYGDVLHPVKCRGHDGGVPGFTSAYRYCPDAGVGYVMLLNGSFSLRAYLEIRMLLFEALTEGMDLAPPARGSPTREELERVAGFYDFANPRHELAGFLERLLGGMNVVHEDGQLVLRPLMGGSIALVPTPDGGFRLPHEGGTSIRFDRDRDGDDVMLLHGGHFERGSLWLAHLKLRAVQTALRIMQYAVVAFVLWLILLLAKPAIGRAVTRVEVGLLAPPALASLTLFAAVVLVQVVPLERFMTRTPESMGLCALTIAYAMFSGIGVATALAAIARGGETSRSLVRAFAMLASSTCFAMTMWLLVNGIIGLRTWSY